MLCAYPTQSLIVTNVKAFNQHYGTAHLLKSNDNQIKDTKHNQEIKDAYILFDKLKKIKHFNN